MPIRRVTRSKQAAQATYDKLSKWYDAMSGRFEKKFAAEGLQRLNVQEGETVLEVGFGTGHCIEAMARAVGDSGKVYGLDISEGMRQITRSRVEQAGLSARVKLELGDAAKLPFEADLFDAVFISFALELFDTPEIPVVLQECRRVLKSGGRICVVAMSKKGKEDSAMVKLYEWMHTQVPNYADCRPIYVQRALKEAGFQIREATESSLWRVPVEIVIAQKA